MAQEKALSAVQPGDGPHVLLGKFKVKDVEILLHPFPVGRLRNDDDAALDQEAQGRLRRSLAVLLSDVLQHRIREKSIAAFREGPPGHITNKGKNKPFPGVGQGLLNGRLLQSAVMDCTVHCSRLYGPLQRTIQSAAGDCSNLTDRQA